MLGLDALLSPGARVGMAKQTLAAMRRVLLLPVDDEMLVRDNAAVQLVSRVVSDFTVRVRDNGVCLLLRRLCCVLVMSRD